MYIIFNLVAFACFAALMAVAAFYDLALSKAIGDRSNLFGIFFEVVGESPSYLVLPVVSPIIFYNARNFDNKNIRITLRVIGALLGWIGYFVWMFSGSKPGKIDIPGNTVFAVFVGFVGGAFGLWVGSMIDKKIMDRLLKWAFFAIAVMLASLIVIQAMKWIWGRMRYRDMQAAGNYDGFTPWYKVNIGNGKETYKSFPSGHTSSAANIFIIVVLCDIFPKWNKLKVRALVNALCTLFVCVVAISRVVNCAHFLSDTLVGGYVTYLIFVIMRYAFFSKGKYIYEIKELSGEEQSS
ncbi:MAG: phosphatase PAP2 family protein [Clostridia bacterium]|nr:phosphatase PAP2 family protein [Clostridia bacterium]